MTPTEIQVLQQACQAARIDASKIQPENPFKKSGSTATLLQAAVAEFAPAQAAKWRCEAGGGLSIQTLSEMQAGGELSDAALADLWNHDAQFVQDRIQEQSKSEERILAAMDKETDRLRRKRDGDKVVDAQNAKAAADQEAKEESLRRHNELQQRMNASRQQADALVGRFVQS